PERVGALDHDLLRLESRRRHQQTEACGHQQLKGFFHRSELTISLSTAPAETMAIRLRLRDCVTSLSRPSSNTFTASWRSDHKPSRRSLLLSAIALATAD